MEETIRKNKLSKSMAKISKKESILETALELFATQGVAKTSTSQITKAAGVAEGTLYVHFKNKQALVDALYVSVKKNEAEAFSTVIDFKKDAETNVRALSKKVMAHFSENYKELLFIEHVNQLHLVSSEALAKGNNHFSEISKDMKLRQENGEIKKLDIEIINGIVWSMLVFTIHYNKRNKNKKTDKTIDMIWDAIRSSQP